VSVSSLRMEWDAVRYDKVSTPQARWGRVVLERLELAGDETVLDAGCGTGRVTEELLKALPEGHVVALDASAPMIEQAKSRLAGAAGRVSFLHVDLLDLGPAVLDGAGPLDAVFSTATFHWVTDHERLFANIRSVLRPEGQFVAQCGGEGNIAGLLEVVRSLGVERAGTWLYASPEETTSRLERAGFADIKVWSHPEPVTFSDRTALVDFLQTVCLREHLATIDPQQQRAFTERVAAAMPVPTLDYVRLNIVARAK
jgi:trans-aconitate 2-methyltransferase